MTDDHKTAGTDKGSEVGRVLVELLDLGPPCLRVVELLRLFASMHEQCNFVADLLLGSTFVDLADDVCAFLDLSMPCELSVSCISYLA